MTPMFPTLDAAANVRITQEGYMLATPRVARAGVDPYTAGEIERYIGRRFDRDVRVYVPPEELFAPATMRSLADCTITLGHPPEKINARNWRNPGGRSDRRPRRAPRRAFPQDWRSQYEQRHL